MFCSSSSLVSATIAKSLAGMPLRWGLSPYRPNAMPHRPDFRADEHDAARDARREVLLEDAAVDDLTDQGCHAAPPRPGVTGELPDCSRAMVGWSDRETIPDRPGRLSSRSLGVAASADRRLSGGRRRVEGPLPARRRPGASLGPTRGCRSSSTMRRRASAGRFWPSLNLTPAADQRPGARPRAEPWRPDRADPGVERPKPTLGLIAREQALLLGGDRRRVLDRPSPRHSKITVRW